MKRIKDIIKSFLYTNPDNELLREGVLIYFVFCLLIIVYILDTIISLDNKAITILNLINIFITLVFAVLFIRKIASYELSLILILYILLFNQMIIQWIRPAFSPEYPAYFFRSTILFGMIMPVLSLVNNKKHVLIVGFHYITFFIVSLIISKNEFLIKNSPIIILCFFVYYKSIYNLTKRLEKSRSDLKELNKKILQKNEDLEAQAEYLDQYNIKLDEQNCKIEEQKEELQKLILTRDKFYSIISHDLKNPIGALMNFSDLIYNKINNSQDEELKKYCLAVKKSSIQSYNLLISLLEWTRIQTGNVKIASESFNLSDALLELVEFYTPMSENKKIKLYHNISNKLIITVDKNMIITAIRNLITNAIKFTHPGGSVSIRLEKIEDQVRFTISDTGIGINQEDLENLFNADIRAHRPGTANEAGTGLGLLLCKEFIELNKGKIYVNSIPQKGSVFWFTLPIEPSVITTKEL